MSFNTFGKIFRFTTWGESHGPAIGCVIDGCPPNISLSEKDIQIDMDRRRPGKSKFTSQRKESDKVKILSGIFQGKTTGTPISMLIHNEDAKSRDYETIKNKFRPGHADYTYFLKYGIRDYRGGGRQSARETASRVAAGAVARVVLNKLIGKKFKVLGAVTQLGILDCNKDKWIEKDRKKSINQIFKTKGESYFRQLEQGQIKNLKSQENGVIATGGGTPCHLNTLELMKNMGQVVYLKTDKKVLFERIKQERPNRPLIKNIPLKDLVKYIEKEMNYREPFYSKANLIIEATNLTPEKICQEIIANCY